MIYYKSYNQIFKYTKYKKDGLNMLNPEEFLSLESCWEKLEKTNKPIFIYGMGDGCLKLMKELNRRKIPISGIFASDEFVRGHYFEGHLVHKLSEIEESSIKNGYEFIILLAFAAGYQELITKIDELEKKHTLIMPDTAVIGGEPFLKEHFIKHFGDIKTVYNMLCDNTSRKVFKNILKYKITGELRYLREVTTEPDEAFENIIKLNSDEVYVDLGAFNGDTALDFARRTNYRYKAIYAFEPNKRNFKKLSRCAEGLNNIKTFNSAAWSSNTTLIFNTGGGRQSQVSKKGIETDAKSVDSVLDGKYATYIKYDVEGAEKEAIKGTEHTIKTYSPKLCIAVYHRLYDMFDIPLQIKNINPDYKFYLRHYPYYPAWETNLFCIP